MHRAAKIRRAHFHSPEARSKVNVSTSERGRQGQCGFLTRQNINSGESNHRVPSTLRVLC